MGVLPWKSDAFQYEISTKTWSELAGMAIPYFNPVKNNHHQMMLGDTLYVFGLEPVSGGQTANIGVLALKVNDPTA